MHTFLPIGLVLYNSQNLLERYNAPDTLKCQHTFHLTQGHCLYSDMGRILASIVNDSAAGHETICGNTLADHIAAQYGARDYQNDGNDWRQNGQDAFLIELTKYGLNRADLPANINFFNKCSIADDGGISLFEPKKTEGMSVTLRLEMDCLVVLHTCPHPLLKRSEYPHGEVSLAIADAASVEHDDLCMNSCEENKRGFENNRIYHLGF